ncbi:hypothetical protein HDV00_004531 [Rhizophlyctis rosea]|nr:hypothetical protein HDV00_004531 [Rhizophlyctis rosea]
MVAISIHPLPNNTGLVVGYNNATQWAIEGLVRLVPGKNPDITPSSSSTPTKPAYTATSVQIRLNVSSGAQVWQEKQGIIAAIRDGGKNPIKWNGLEHLNSSLELVPQTHEGANAVVVREDEEVDLPFRFEFNTPLPPTCEIERGRYNAYSRYRLSVTVEGRPNGAKHLLEPRRVSLDQDVAVPYYDTTQGQALLKPVPQKWSGSTDELDWEIHLGSLTTAPNEFTSVFLRANLNQRRPANPKVAEPTSAAIASLTKQREAGAPFIRRATFTLVEEAMINLYTVSAAALPESQNLTMKKREEKELVQREFGGGQDRIMRVEVDGEHLEKGHELKIQLPGLAPVCPTPGSRMDGKYKASVDAKMSTGDVSAIADTRVQINPTGSWGTFQVTHLARVLFEVADGHNVLWETPVIITSAASADYRNLAEQQPSFLSGSAQQQQAFTTATQPYQEQFLDDEAPSEAEAAAVGGVRKMDSSGAIGIERPAIPTAQLGSHQDLTAVATAR